MTPDQKSAQRALEAISLIDRALQDAVNVLGTEACFHDGRCQALQQVRLILKEIAPRPAKAGDKVCAEDDPTPKMVYAGLNKLNCSKMDWDDRKQNIIAVYKAMLAASPAAMEAEKR